MIGEPTETDRIRAAYARRRDDVRLGPVAEYVVAERRGLIRRLAAAHFGGDLGNLRVCDIGCGAGGDLAAWRDAGVRETGLAGTELLQEPLTAARAALPAADLRLVDGFVLPWEDRTFDLAWASMTFSSIRDAASRRQLFTEMWRVTRPGGLLALYDFRVRKPTNPDVVAMTQRTIGALGEPPFRRVAVTPLLPALPLVLRLPDPVRTGLLRMLPRTHAIWIWVRDGSGATTVSW